VLGAGTKRLSERSSALKQLELLERTERLEQASLLERLETLEQVSLMCLQSDGRLDPQVKRKILYDNPRRFYRIESILACPKDIISFGGRAN
jgi:hypothetical protein